MQIINLQTNAESIQLGSTTDDLCAGCSVRFDGTASIRSVDYADDGTNVYTVAILPGSVVVTADPDPLHEIQMGMTFGLVIVPALVIVMLVKKYFARGDAFDV